MSNETQNISQLQFGAPVESVADNRAEVVQLTRFNQLKEQANYNQDFSDRIKSKQGSDRIPNSLSAMDLSPNSNKKQKQLEAIPQLSQSNMSLVNNSKWPWAQLSGKLNNPSDQTQLSLNYQRFQKQQQLTQTANEPFQVVWQKLAFEVKVSAYDKLISKFLTPMKSKFLNSNSHVNNGNNMCHMNESSGEIIMNPAVVDDNNNNNESIFNNIKQTKLDCSDIINKPTSQHNNNDNNHKRVIFENLNGFFRSGEITAILGPSGAGKTSLLNAISGKPDNYRGRIQLLGGEGGKRRMRLSIIPQRDYLIENLTVRENLLYASKILNTSKTFDHEANILRVSKMLNLDHCFHSMTSMISGGEYKRVSIAQELLRQPDILILDEPTSGLDSLNCKNLIKLLVKLIENSRLGYIQPIAIVMTIHQPDIEIYQMFDHVYCMARHGKVIYDGPPKDTLDTIREHADLLGPEIEARLGRDSSIVANPANLLIEIASENLYGQRPIDLLAEHQRKQFALLMNNAGSYLSSSTNLSSASVSSDLDKQKQTASHNGNQLIISMPPLQDEQESKPELNLNLNKITNSNKIFMKQLQLLNVAIDSNIDSSSSNGSQEFSSEQNNESSSMNNLKNSFYITSYISSSNNNNNNNNKKTKDNNEKCNYVLIRDKRLQAKIDHGGKFWHHTNILARRAFTATIRDPLMVVVALLFHLSIPFVMSTVYSPIIGEVKGCPKIQKEFDLISMSSNNTADIFKQLQEDVHATFECSTMFFLTTYCFSLCSLTVAALTFPLNMHVLLKEVRNGWYNLSSFVVAKTISNSPFEVCFPVISIVMIYALLGMPDSYMYWRLVTIGLVMALISMVSSTQGFLFGALCMDSLQTSIFLSICSTLPQVVLSGFTSRIYLMPKLLQYLSWFSLYRYSSDSINIIRFGYGSCACNNETDDYLRTHPASFKEIPSNVKPLFNYYLSNTANDINNNSSQLDPTDNRIVGLSYDSILNSTERNKLINLIDSNELDVFDNMASILSRSFTYGNNIRDCGDVRSEILVRAGTPKDEYLPYLLAGLFGILILLKVILFITVKCKIRSKL